MTAITRTPVVNDGQYQTAVAAAATAQGLRLVTNSSGEWAIATAAQPAQAISYESVGIGEILTGRLVNAGGVVYVKAAGAITRGAACYAAADGEVASSGTIIEGYAIEAAAADGDVIPMVVSQRAVGATGLLAYTKSPSAAEVTADAVTFTTGLGTTVRGVFARAHAADGSDLPVAGSTYNATTGVVTVSITNAALAETSRVSILVVTSDAPASS